jgi:hypothetical protein
MKGMEDIEDFSNGKDWKGTLEEISRTAKATSVGSLIRIEEIAQSVDAVRFFVAVFANMAISPAEHISELTHGDVPAKLELLAFNIYPFFGVSAEKNITPYHMQDCIDALNKLFISRIHHRTFSSEKDQTNSADRFARSLRVRAEIVRGSAYPEQTAEEIVSIQGKFESWFAQRVNIGPKRARELLWAIGRTQEETINTFMGEVIGHARAFGELWNEAKKKPPKQRTDTEQWILNICKDKKSAEIFGYVARLNEMAPELIPIHHTKVKYIDPHPSDEEWNALCNLIGLTTENRKNMVEPIEVRQRPLFVLPDNRVVLADISNALDALWDSFDRVARNDQTFYDVYQKRKANWLEEKVFTCLSRIFPSHHVYRKLSYPNPDKLDGSTAELDMAVYWPPFLVLIEAKAKQFRLESQLGDLGRLRTDIKANVEDAFQQAKRAERYINKTENPEFTEVSSGRRLSFQRNNIRRTYLLTVSQHHLAGIVNELAEFKDIGLFREGEYPLSICVADFELISEFCSGPDVFLHYIGKRIEIQSEPVNFVNDELDFFGAYLDCRLQADRLWTQEGKPVDWVCLSGWSEKFDQLMEYRRGERETPPTIRLKVPNEIENILLELRSRTNDEGARWIAFALLSMSDKNLGAIAQGIKEIRKAELTPGMFRRMTYQDRDTVISIVASLDLSTPMLRRTTALRATLEKYRRKVSRSIGIGIMVADNSKPFDCATWLEGPWEYDEEMEKILNSEPAFVLAPGEKLPGRNAPCVCGSGKKFLKCCLPKMEIPIRKTK